MQSSFLQDIQRHVKRLPALPASVQRLIAVADDPDASVRELIKVIEKEQTFTVRLLRVANSSFYGLPRRVGTVAQATVLIGASAVKNLALGIAMSESQRQSPKGLKARLNAFWKHSLAVASAAQLLVERFQLPDAEGAFVAGLLHDIGKMVLLEVFGEHYARLPEWAEQTPLFALEQEAFGIDHAATGRALCEHWRLPVSLTRVVAAHHSHPPQDIASGDSLIGTVRVANELAKIAQIGDGGNPCVELEPFRAFRSAVHQKTLQAILQGLPSAVGVTEAACFGDIPNASFPPGERDTRPVSVGVCLKTPEARDVVALALHVQGCTVVPIEETLPSDSSVAGVIADDALPAALKERLTQQGVPLLSLAFWQSGDAMGPCTSVNMKHLHTWISKASRKAQSTP